jgi:hypothetical protein
MVDVATMAPIQSGKAKAGTKGAQAKGHALAQVCIKYGIKRMEQEEREAGKLGSIVRSISELAREGHAEFRAQLTAELNLLKELRKTADVGKEHTSGYSFTSFETLCSNWKTISAAVEMGYSIKDDNGNQKAWSLVLAESVHMKHAHAANSADPAVPTKRKVGRKATPLIDKAIKAAEELLENNPADFLKFAEWMQNTVKAMKESQAKPETSPM